MIYPVFKHIWINNNKLAIEFTKSKLSVPTFKKPILPSRTNAAKTIVYGFPLLGLIGLDENEKNRQIIDTIKKGLLYLQVSNQLNYLEYNIVPIYLCL